MGAFTTKTVAFPGAGSLPLITWDESGSGIGPYSFVNISVDGAGNLVSPATAANQLLPYDVDATAYRALLVGPDASPLTSDPEAHLGNLGGHTPNVSASFVRAASGTQYTAGDRIGPSTATDLLEFTVARNTLSDSNRSGRVTGGTCTINCASGTIVFPSFSLFLFRPVADIPFASGSLPADNAAMSFSAVALHELVAKLDFGASWMSHLGGAGQTGTVAWQEAAPAKRPYATFNFTGLGQVDLLGVVQDQGGWNPGNIANTIHFTLDVDQD